MFGIEIHGAGLAFVQDDANASFAGEPELPLASVRMPVQFAHGSRLDRNHSSSDVLGYREVARVNDANLTPRCLAGGSHGFHPEGVLERRFDTLPSDRCLILRKRQRTVCRENVERGPFYKFGDDSHIETKAFPQTFAALRPNNLQTT